MVKATHLYTHYLKIQRVFQKTNEQLQASDALLSTTLQQGGCLAQQFRCCLGHLHPNLEHLGWSPSSTCDSSFLLICILGDSRCWLKWLGPCPLCGKAVLSPRFLGIWRVNKKFILLSHSNESETDKDLKLCQLIHCYNQNGNYGLQLSFWKTTLQQNPHLSRCLLTPWPHCITKSSAQDPRHRIQHRILQGQQRNIGLLQLVEQGSVASSVLHSRKVISDVTNRKQAKSKSRETILVEVSHIRQSIHPMEFSLIRRIKLHSSLSQFQRSVPCSHCKNPDNAFQVCVFLIFYHIQLACSHTVTSSMYFGLTAKINR